jgi:hypothetical protein
MGKKEGPDLILNEFIKTFPLELKFRVFPRTVFPGNYHHWYFPTNPGHNLFSKSEFINSFLLY